LVYMSPKGYSSPTPAGNAAEHEMITMHEPHAA
jgi:hypothetical protein